MTTIDYKQKIKDYMNSSEVDTLYKSMLNNLFPELKESEDERVKKEIISAIKEDWSGHTDWIDWLEKQGEKKLTARSEEDEEMLNVVIKSCEKCGNEYAYYWLKSLKDRVLPQPQQKWSEEDDTFFKAIIRDIENTQYISEDAKKDRTTWLKSLKERYTWKPSDEQMNALNYVVNLMASSERPTENDLYYNILKSLRQQLMKLKDEK